MNTIEKVSVTFNSNQNNWRRQKDGMKDCGEFQFCQKQNFRQNNCHQNFRQLRGGGCGASQPIPQEEITIPNIDLPKDFLIRFNNHCDTLIQQAKMLMEGQNSFSSIMISIQWFHYNGEYFNICCTSKQYDKQIYDLFLEKAQALLIILPIYIRSQCFLAYSLLQIINEILRVLFAFQFNNKQRVLEEQRQTTLLDYVENIHQEFEIEKDQIWKTGIDYELKILENLLHNSQTNHSEGKGLLQSFILNLVTAYYKYL